MIQYTGRRYNFRNYNCYDHAVAVRKDHGIKTKLFKPKTLENAFQVITAEMQKLDHGMLRVDAPQDFDIVIVSRSESGRIVYHCGVYHQGNVSHCCRCAGQVRYQPYSEFIQDYETVDLWR